MGHAAGAGEADGLADLPHTRRIAASFDRCSDDFEHPTLTWGETGLVRWPVREVADGAGALRVTGGARGRFGTATLARRGRAGSPGGARCAVAVVTDCHVASSSPLRPTPSAL